MEIESKLTLINQAAPSTPASGKTELYVGTDKLLHWKDDTGVNTIAAPAGASYITESAEAGLSAESVLGSTIITTTTHATRQASAKAGRLHVPSDGVSIGRDTGSAWATWGPVFPLTSPPVSSGFTWINQSTTTVSDVLDALLITSLTGGASDMHCLVKTAPATPWTVTIGFLFNALTMAGNGHAGLCFRQSSDGKLHRYGIINASGFSLVSSKQTNATTFSAHYIAATIVGGFLPGVIWLRISDNGTNRICSWSADKQNWLPFHTVTRTDFLTADQYGIYITPGTATNYMTIISLEIA